MNSQPLFWADREDSEKKAPAIEKVRWNLRKLSELPRSLVISGNQEEMIQLFLSNEFCEAKVSSVLNTSSLSISHNL